jgi:hypothetical protein
MVGKLTEEQPISTSILSGNLALCGLGSWTWTWALIDDGRQPGRTRELDQDARWGAASCWIELDRSWSWSGIVGLWFGFRSC